MRQEVNLLKNDLSPSSQGLSFDHSLWGVVVFSMALLLYIYNQYASLKDMKNDVVELQQQIDSIAIPPIDNSGLITYKSKINSLEEVLSQKKGLVAKYTQLSYAEKTGFSQYFTHIANFSNVKLSIDHIKVFNGGRHLIFSGYSVNPQSIPEYINKLKEQVLFSNVMFGELRIERINSSNKMRFFLEDNVSPKVVVPRKGG